MKTLGYGREYRYPHDYEGKWIPEIYLPEEVRGARFYEPGASGWEGRWRDQLSQRREKVKEFLERKDSGVK